MLIPPNIYCLLEDGFYISYLKETMILQKNVKTGNIIYNNYTIVNIKLSLKPTI